MREFDSEGVTLVHMIRRAAGMTPDAFQRAWLGVDLQALGDVAGLLGYGQNHALLRGYAKGELLFDGFEEFTFEDAQALAQARSRGGGTIVRDETRACIDPSASLFAVVDISVQKDGLVPPGAIRSTEFVNRRPDLSIPDFRRYWLETHGPLATGIPQIIRYEQHHLHDGGEAAQAPRFDGWAATWFESTAAMRDAAREAVYRRTRLDEPNFLAGPLPVLFTKERLAFRNR